jgi:hypothetical protein
MTNALQITGLPQKEELYWSEADGVHSAKPDGEGRNILLRTPAIGTSPPILFEEASPTSSGALFNLEFSNYSPSYLRVTVDFLPGNQFRMGYGRNYLSGTFVWTKSGTHTALLRLDVQGKITAFPPNSTRPLDAETVQEAYQKTLGANPVDLPRTLDLALSFRDSSSGEIVSTELLASNNRQEFSGKFTASGGDYSGIPRTYPLPLSLPGATIQKLEPQKNQGQIVTHLLDAGGNPIQETLPR